MNDKLENYRKHLKLDKSKMSKFLGVPRTTYISWENGAREPGASAKKLIDLMQLIESIAPDIFNKIKKQ